MPLATVAPSGQLLPVPIPSPGSLGLNLQQANQVLPPQWCIEAQNAVIDYGGRLAARLGVSNGTSSAATGQIRSIFEYRTPAGGSLPIVGYDGGISSSITAPSGSSLVGTITSVASGRWYFQNFNGKCIGFQSGQKPVVMQSQTGTFSNIVESSGTAPQGGIGCCAFGRVWGIDSDGQTLKWCALLDETNWGTGDSGSINLSKVWPLGMDTVTAITAFNGALVVFGVRQILFYGSSNPSAIGLDVTTIALVDTLEGTGCISQWTIAPVGETDLIFCSSIGIQSLQRLLIQRSRPTTLLSKYVRDTMISQLQAETASAISGFYSPTQGFYALCLPVSGYVWVADQRHIYQDSDGDTVARMTRWTMSIYAGAEFYNRTLYLTVPWTGTGASGSVGIYNSTGGGDNGANFQFIMQLPWTDFGQEIASRLKAFKSLSCLLAVPSATTVNFQWFIDFSPSGRSASVATQADAGAMWGVGQWGYDQWSGGALVQLLNRALSGTGQYFSIQISANVGGNFAIQQINLLAKILRIAYGTYT
jgi:hypothetical protein